MTRVSKLSSPEDFEVESHREAIRDRRWQRHRNMLFCFAALLVLLGVTTPAPSIFLRWL
jgi:hypothetical protein